MVLRRCRRRRPRRQSPARGHRRRHADGDGDDARIVDRVDRDAGLRAHQGGRARIGLAGAVDVGQRLVADPVVGRRDPGRDARAAARRHRHAQPAGHGQHIAVVARLHRHARQRAAGRARFDLAGIADACPVAAVTRLMDTPPPHRHGAHGHAAGDGDVAGSRPRSARTPARVRRSPGLRCRGSAPSRNASARCPAARRPRLYDRLAPTATRWRPGCPGPAPPRRPGC